MDALASARRIEGDGTGETLWRRWLAASPTSRRALPELLDARTRLVVVAPHPDDEVLACGGLLASHLARGGRALVVAVSDGEASHGAGQDGHALRLADTRRAESVEGLRRLGASAAQVLSLHLPDGGIVATDLALRLMQVLQPPDLVVSTWRLDGHPDHDAAGEGIAQACAATGCRMLEAPVWMWHWAAPGDARVPWHRLVAFALAPDIVLRKQRAIAAHASQLGPRGPFLGPVLGAEIVARAGRDTEYFFE